MAESILRSIKDALEISDDDTDFDGELIMDINSAFLALNQLGVGPEKVFHIDNYDATWDDFLGEGITDTYAAKTVIALRVKLIFEAATLTSNMVSVLKEQIHEMEWRLMAQHDLAQAT